MFLWSCRNLNPVISDHIQFLIKNPTYRSKWEVIRAMPEAHYCGKSVGNSSHKMAETIVNTGSLPLWRHFAVADEKYFYHCCITSHFLVFLGISGFVSPCKKLLSGINWCVMAYVTMWKKNKFFHKFFHNCQRKYKKI